MGTDTLTEFDRQLLRRLSMGPQTPESLTDAAGEAAETVADRLAVLDDSGVVRQTGDTYELTDSGRRLLAAPGDGTADNRIDVPLAVERELGVLDVAHPCAAALRAAYAFLQYWGDATASELRDAVFSERPAGNDSRHQWWNDCIEPVFGTLPAVGPPQETDSLADQWHYERPPGVEAGSADGRAVLGSTERRRFGTARQAIEALADSADQRLALRSGFAALETAGRVGSETLETHLVDAIGLGPSIDPEAILDLLAGVPAVERTAEGSETVWRYRHDAQSAECGDQHQGEC